MAENTSQKINISDSIKIITPPDVIHDQSKKILVIQPQEDLKQKLESWAIDQDCALSIYYFTRDDKDINWLLTAANICSNIIVDMDNCDDNISRFLSYLLSLPHTYYRCTNMDVQWDLLNRNRFWDFPNFGKDFNG